MLKKLVAPLLLAAAVCAVALVPAYLLATTGREGFAAVVILGSLVGDPGPVTDRLPDSSGEAISRLRALMADFL